jgi:hypothetical protein
MLRQHSLRKLRCHTESLPPRLALTIYERNVGNLVCALLLLLQPRRLCATTAPPKQGQQGGEADAQADAPVAAATAGPCGWHRFVDAADPPGRTGPPGVTGDGCGAG